MITIIAVGKQEYCKKEFELYLKRLRNYSDVKFIEVREEKDRNPEIVRRKEGEKILAKAEGHVAVLDASGQQFSSEEFAGFLKRKKEENKKISFVVGGAFGLSKDVLDRADAKISLSRMTLQHDICRIFLLEQIYRAFTIMNKGKYHK